MKLRKKRREPHSTVCVLHVHRNNKPEQQWVRRGPRDYSCCTYTTCRLIVVRAPKYECIHISRDNRRAYLYSGTLKSVDRTKHNIIFFDFSLSLSHSFPQVLLRLSGAFYAVCISICWCSFKMCRRIWFMAFFFRSLYSIAKSRLYVPRYSVWYI